MIKAKCIPARTLLSFYFCLKNTPTAPGKKNSSSLVSPFFIYTQRDYKTIYYTYTIVYTYSIYVASCKIVCSQNKKNK